MQTHDKQTPWKNFLVVLEGNVENRAKKPKGSSQKKDKASTASSKAGSWEQRTEDPRSLGWVRRARDHFRRLGRTWNHRSGQPHGPGRPHGHPDRDSRRHTTPALSHHGRRDLSGCFCGRDACDRSLFHPHIGCAFHRSFSINIRFCAHHRGRSRFRRHTGSGKDCGDIRSRSNREQSGFGWVCVCPGCYDGRDGLCRHPTGSHWKHQTTGASNNMEISVGE